MDFTPLFDADIPIPHHALFAFGALALGIAQLSLPKGTLTHKAFGYLWVILMAGTALTALFIHELRVWGNFSPIHLLIPITLGGLWLAIRAAKRGDIRRHRFIMLILFASALVITGFFTLLPGRIMYEVLF